MLSQYEEGELLLENHRLEIEFEDNQCVRKNRLQRYESKVITIQRAWRDYKRRKSLTNLTEDDKNLSDTDNSTKDDDDSDDDDIDDDENNSDDVEDDHKDDDDNVDSNDINGNRPDSTSSDNSSDLNSSSADQPGDLDYRTSGEGTAPSQQQDPALLRESQSEGRIGSQSQSAASMMSVGGVKKGLSMLSDLGSSVELDDKACYETSPDTPSRSVNRRPGVNRLSLAEELAAMEEHIAYDDIDDDDESDYHANSSCVTSPEGDGGDGVSRGERVGKRPVVSLSRTIGGKGNSSPPDNDILRTKGGANSPPSSTRIQSYDHNKNTNDFNANTSTTSCLMEETELSEALAKLKRKLSSSYMDNESLMESITGNLTGGTVANNRVGNGKTLETGSVRGGEIDPHDFGAINKRGEVNPLDRANTRGGEMTLCDPTHVTNSTTSSLPCSGKRTAVTHTQDSPLCAKTVAVTTTSTDLVSDSHAGVSETSRAAHKPGVVPPATTGLASSSAATTTATAAATSSAATTCSRGTSTQTLTGTTQSSSTTTTAPCNRNASGPLVGKSDPSGGNRRPSLGKSDTSGGNRRPSLGKSDTTVGKRRPSLGKTDTSVGNRDPSVVQSEAAVGKSNPIEGKSESSGGKSNPSLVENNPSVGKRLSQEGARLGLSATTSEDRGQPKEGVAASRRGQLAGVEAPLPVLDWDSLEKHLAKMEREEEQHQSAKQTQKNSRQEILRKLAMGADDEGAAEGDIYGKGRDKLSARLQAGMNLQICFVNEDLDDSDEEESSRVSATAAMATAAESTIPGAIRVGNRDSRHLFSRESSANSSGSASSPKAPSVTFEDIEDFESKKAHLQEEARLAWAKAEPLAKLQMELERQQRKNLPPSELSHVSGLGDLPMTLLCKRFQYKTLSRMSLSKVQILLNNLHTQVERLNEELVTCLLARDSYKREQESRLIDIEDLNRLTAEKQQQQQQPHEQRSTHWWGRAGRWT